MRTVVCDGLHNATRFPGGLPSFVSDMKTLSDAATRGQCALRSLAIGGTSKVRAGRLSLFLIIDIVERSI